MSLSLWIQSDEAWSRFKQSGKIEDLDSAINLQHATLDACHDGQLELNRAEILYLLAFSYEKRHEHLGQISDCEKAITLSRDALELRPNGHADRPCFLENLTMLLHTRFKHSKRLEDIEEAVALERAVLQLRSKDDPLRSDSLEDLTLLLQARFDHRESMEDLEEVITLKRAVLDLRPDGHPDHCQALEALAFSLSARFEHRGSIEDLEEVITLERTVVELLPDDHPDRPSALDALAVSLSTRFEHYGVLEDLDEAITLERAALELRRDEHPDYHLSLDNLAVFHKERFEHLGVQQDLEDAVTLSRAALELRPEGHPLRPLSLGNLASILSTYFEYSGRSDYLEEAIALERAALELRPKGHPGRHFSLDHLAVSLNARFRRRGMPEDLEEAVTLSRGALELRPEGHPQRPSSLGNLASILSTCFEYRGRPEYLEEAITLERAALELRPKGHPDRPLWLCNLASSLWDLFELHGRIEDLEEAITLDRAALELRPEGHLHRSLSLSSLASSLATYFDHYKRLEDLEEAITLERAALNLRPEGHIHRSLSLHCLAAYLSTSFEHSGRIKDLEESIALDHASLDLRPEGHPLRSLSFRNLAESHYVRFQRIGSIDDLEEAIKYLRSAVAHTFSSFSKRLGSVYRWIAIARSHDHHTLAEAYRAALALVQRALTIRPSLFAQHKFLSGDGRYKALALDAAAHAIDKDDFPWAVELLEQGRALLWSQLRGLRTPLDQLSEVDKTLAERFEDCNRRLEALISSSDSNRSESSIRRSTHSASLGRMSIDEVYATMRQLAEEQEAIINDIRRIPGFENFLQATPFKVLRKAASEGPVIMVNFSERRSDALIILQSTDVPCICVPLDQGFYADFVELHKELVRGRGKSRLSSKKYDETLRRVMKALWDRIVSRVVEKLKEVGITEGSRIWWCPTSVLTAFPFHAAGPYTDSNGKTKYLLDDYISSYTPTVTSLISAQSGGGHSGSERLLVIGDTGLPSTNRERHAINRIRRIDKQLLDKRATPSVAIRALRNAEWVHFVCHGLLDKDPFNSSFKLPGGKLTLLDIARARLPNAEFAFLSACHTAEQGPDSALDESLHLAAAMQFCGFRSVIGTMWQLLDRDGPFLSKAVYVHLTYEMKEDEVKFKGAAAAVRKAALSLREWKDEGPNGEEMEVMTERWVNLVHIGA